MLSSTNSDLLSLSLYDVAVQAGFWCKQVSMINSSNGVDKRFVVAANAPCLGDLSGVVGGQAHVRRSLPAAESDLSCRLVKRCAASVISIWPAIHLLLVS